MKKKAQRLLIFTTLFSSTVFLTHMLNKFIAATAQLKEILDFPRKRFYEWRFGKIHYVKKGSGSPILLVHDMLPGASSYEWSKIIDDLSKEHTVYAIDLIGCGNSDKPGITYTNFLYVQLLNDFIKDIIKENTDIIASGFSNSFVIMTCLNNSSLINKVIMINPPKLSSTAQTPKRKQHVLKLLLEIPIFGTLVYHMIVARESIYTDFIEKYYYNPFHVDKDFVDAFYEAAHIGGFFAKHTYSSFIAKYMNIDITHALESIDNSIFIIEGSDEPGASTITSEYNQVNLSVEVATISETKHLPHIEKPEMFLDQLKTFL